MVPSGRVLHRYRGDQSDNVMRVNRKSQRKRYKLHAQIKGKYRLNVRARTIIPPDGFTCIADFPEADRPAIAELVRLGYNIQIGLL